MFLFDFSKVHNKLGKVKIFGSADQKWSLNSNFSIEGANIAPPRIVGLLDPFDKELTINLLVKSH